MAATFDGIPAENWKRLSSAELEVVLSGHLRFLQRRPGGQRALLAFHDLEECDLGRRDLCDAEMSGVRLQRAHLNGTKLRSAVLFAADLRLANLNDADLRRADLRGACFRGAE